MKLSVASVSLALVSATAFAGAAEPAEAQTRARVVIDDPGRALGGDRDAVRQAASGYESNRRGGPRPRFIISVVPSLGDSSIERVARERLNRHAPRGSVQDLVLVIAPREATALLTVRDIAALARALRIRRLSAANTLTHASGIPKIRLRSGGDAGDAALAAIEDFAGPSREPEGRQPGWRDALSLLLPVLPLTALFFGWRGLRARRRLKAFGGGVTQVRDLKPGQAMVSGIALADAPLTAPISGTSCVAWQVTAEEQYHRTKTERRYNEHVRSDGSAVRDEYDVKVPDTPGWSNLGSTGDSTSFVVRDATGEVLVWPAEAELKTSTHGPVVVGRKHAAYAIVGKREHHDSLGIRRLVEGVIPVDTTITAIGPVQNDGDRPEIRWTRRLGPSVRNRFFITVDEPAAAQREERRRMIRQLGIAAASVGGLIFILI